MWELRMELGPGPAAALVFPICVAMCLSLGLNFARAGKLEAAASASRSSWSCSGVAEVMNCEIIAVAMPAKGGTGGPPTKMLAALLSAPVRARTPADWACWAVMSAPVEQARVVWVGP